MMMKKSALLLAVGVLLTACGPEEVVEKETNTIFDVKSKNYTQINFANTLTESDELNIIEYLYYYNGAGVAVGDINADGLEDIYFAANQQPDRLYLNKGNLVFEDVTSSAGLSSEASWSTGVAMADLTGDGHVDIYVCKVGLFGSGVANELYVNNGDGTFTERAAELGLDFRGYSTHAGLLDYDGDGDLDVYLLNHTVHSVRSYGTVDRRSEKDSLSGDLLFENKINEGGGFEDVTTAAGIYSSPLGYGLAVACADVNGDGHTDIYVGNDFHEDDYLYINNGDKTFTERGGAALMHTTQFSMGVDIGDVDGDGLADIFTTDMLPFAAEVLLRSGGEDTDQIKRIKEELGFGKQYARNHLQLSRGDGTFTDAAYMTKTFATDWSWSVLLQDFDNDADKDIFITNGIVRRPNDLDYINYLNEYDQYQKEGDSRTEKLLKQMPTQPLRNLLFTQNGELSFSAVDRSAVGPPSFSTGAAYADLDNDGDLDIVTNNINAEASVLENMSSGNALQIRLVDTSATVVGTSVSVYAGELVQRQEVHLTKGFMSTSTDRLHVGLGGQATVDSVVLYWPDGTVQVERSPPISGLLTVGKRVAVGQQQDRGSVGSPSIGPVYAEFPYTHQENTYYDEKLEKLIPERLSQEGPCALVEDLNGDGYVDIFIGGGKDQAAGLYYGAADGSYRAVSMASFAADARYEDVAVATIDFDRDGDRDLYVVSGGNDQKELNKLLEDRLYLNNDGVYKRIPLSLPHTNGSCISVADYDGDGYEDMFVGGRSIPGSYGLSPYSFLLKNRQGQGVDIGLKERLGMVTGATWSDIDGDADPDLIVYGDWMPIRVLTNDKGELTEQTSTLGLDSTHGLWNSILLRDVNGDGIQDILAGNMGTNMAWQASKEQPVKMYVGDYDANGASEPLIFYDYLGRYMPFASLDVLSSQLPMVKKQFASYEKYADVEDISDILDDMTATVEARTLYELKSVLYLSDGGVYRAVPLPQAVQIAEIRSIAAVEGGGAVLLGGSDTFVAHIGQGGSPVVQRLSWSKEGQLSVETVARLPVDSSPRGVYSLPEGQLLITQNGGKPLLVD